MCIYEKLMSSVSKGIKNALTEEQEIISSNGILSASEKEDLIYDQTEEYLSYHKEESRDDNVLYIDLNSSQTVFIMKKNYRGDDLAMVPVEIVSAEIDTGWRDITFWDEDNKEYIINNIEDGLDELLDEVISNLHDLLIEEGLRDL